MSGEVDLFGRGAPVTRATGRAIDRITTSAGLAVVRVNARADVQACKVDAASAVTQRALQGAAFVSQVEQQLALAVPLAASRLQAIGDIGALGLTQLVMDTINDLHRM
ncbi:MAG TPA: hypothetical protein VHO01_07925 [Jatrophihabitans sp.]|nr:hypothetical protein [Jatrophihabitans sp.]